MSKPIFDPVKMLSDFIEAFDAGQVELNSPEIQIGDEAPHPWHEEWLALAREAVRENKKLFEFTPDGNHLVSTAFPFGPQD